MLALANLFKRGMDAGDIGGCIASRSDGLIQLQGAVVIFLRVLQLLFLLRQAADSFGVTP